MDTSGLVYSMSTAQMRHATALDGANRTVVAVRSAVLTGSFCPLLVGDGVWLESVGVGSQWTRNERDGPPLVVWDLKKWVLCVDFVSFFLAYPKSTD